MRSIMLSVILALSLSASTALADQKGGPFTIFAATVRVVMTPASGTVDVPTLVRYDPKSGKTWVMVPPAAPGSTPYWIPVVDPIDFGSKSP